MKTASTLAALVAVAVLGALAAVSAQPFKLPSPAGYNNCHFGGANGPIIVSTCLNATGASFIHQFYCDITTSPPDCAVIATIPPPTDIRAWNRPLNTTAAQTVISVSGTGNYTAIVARLIEPSLKYETFINYYCSYPFSDNLHNATCIVAGNVHNSMVWRNPIGQVSISTVDGAEIMAAVVGYPSILDDDALDPYVGLYRCVCYFEDGYALAVCEQFQRISYWYYMGATNLTTAVSGYMVAVGDPSYDHGAGNVKTWDCSELSSWSGPESGNCWLIEELRAAERVPWSGFGAGILINPVGRGNQTAITVFSSGYRQLDFTTGAFTSFLCDAPEVGGTCLRVGFTALPFAPYNGDRTNSTGAGALYASSSTGGSVSSVVYVGTPNAHRNVGEVIKYTCDAGVLCTRNREVLYFEDGAISDLLGARVVRTPYFTVAGSGDDRLANGGTYILETADLLTIPIRARSASTPASVADKLLALLRTAP